MIPKEEAWLNEMAAKGLTLVSVRFLAYEFENTLPGEYQVFPLIELRVLAVDFGLFYSIYGFCLRFTTFPNI